MSTLVVPWMGDHQEDRALGTAAAIVLMDVTYKLNEFLHRFCRLQFTYKLRASEFNMVCHGMSKK